VDANISLTKADIIDRVGKKCDFSNAKSFEVVEALLEIMKKTLESGEDVLISGFGKFCVKEKSERRGRNPQLGNELMLGARRVVVFKCSSVLRKKVNVKKFQFKAKNKTFDKIDYTPIERKRTISLKRKWLKTTNKANQSNRHSIPNEFTASRSTYNFSPNGFKNESRVSQSGKGC
jgi:integration host factor subunit alpha